MRPLKPKYIGKVKIELEITKKTLQILKQYSKYSQYTDGEIIDNFASEIIEDDITFIEWLRSRRYKKKIEALIFDTEDCNIDEGAPLDEEFNKDCEL